MHPRRAIIDAIKAKLALTGRTIYEEEEAVRTIDSFQIEVDQGSIDYGSSTRGRWHRMLRVSVTGVASTPELRDTLSLEIEGLTTLTLPELHEMILMACTIDRDAEGGTRRYTVTCEFEADYFQVRAS